MTMVGKAEQDIAEQLTQHEIFLNHDLIAPLNAKLEVRSVCVCVCVCVYVCVCVCVCLCMLQELSY